MILYSTKGNIIVNIFDVSDDERSNLIKELRIFYNEFINSYKNEFKIIPMKNSTNYLFSITTEDCKCNFILQEFANKMEEKKIFKNIRIEFKYNEVSEDILLICLRSKFIIKFDRNKKFSNKYISGEEKRFTLINLKKSGFEDLANDLFNNYHQNAKIQIIKLLLFLKRLDVKETEERKAIKMYFQEIKETLYNLIRIS